MAAIRGVAKLARLPYQQELDPLQAPALGPMQRRSVVIGKVPFQSTCQSR